MDYVHAPRSGAAAILIDPGTLRVRWCNDAVLECVPGTTMTAEVAVGRPLDEMIPLARVTGMATAATKAGATGETQQATVHVPSLDGAGRTLKMTMHRLPDGAVLMLAVVL